MNKEMEEKIYQKINEGLGKTALSERTIRSKAARLAAKIKTDEELTEDVLSDAVEDLRVLAGQLDHDVAEKVRIEAERKAAELLKSRNKQEKPEKTEEKTINEDESPPSWFVSYKEQQERMWAEKLSEVEKKADAFPEHQKRERLNQFLRSEARRLGVPESHLVGMKPVESEDEAREILAAKKEAIVKEGIGSQGVGASEAKKDRDPFVEVAKAETEKLASGSAK